MAQTDSPLGEVREFYDFIGDVVPDQINATGSTAATATVVAGINGIMRVHVDDGDNESSMVAGQLIYEASTGFISVEVRARVDAISDSAFSMGFTDAVTETAGAAGMPAHFNTDCSDALTTTASTGAGFVYDLHSASDAIFAWAVDGDSDHACAPANLTCAPVAATYRTYKVELHDQGCGNKAQAEFYLCGDHKKTMTSAITRGTNLTWFVAAGNRGGSEVNLDVDYIDVRASRGSSTA